MKLNRNIALITVAAGIATLLAGCQALPSVTSAALGAGTAASDTQQKPEANPYQYQINAGFEKAYNAALMSASNMGRVSYQDRTAGLIQFQTGNWITNAQIAKDGSAASASLTFRYVSSSSFDFNSKQKLSEQFVKGITTAGLGVTALKQ
jgi:hypothetical protein